MEQNKYKYLIIEDSKLKRFIADDLNLSGKWSSPGGDARAFTNENEISTEGDIVTIKWYQGKKNIVISRIWSKANRRRLIQENSANIKFKRRENV